MMKTNGKASLLRALPVALLFAGAAQAGFAFSPASADPAQPAVPVAPAAPSQPAAPAAPSQPAAPTAPSQIDSIIVSVATVNTVFGQTFSAPQAETAPSEAEKAVGACGNAQASLFADPWTAYREVHYSTYNNLGPTQRVAVYADEATAKQAFAKLTGQLSGCKTASAPQPAPAASAPTTAPTTQPTSPAPTGDAPAPDAPAPPTSEPPAPAAQGFTVAVATEDAAKWDDYVPFNQISGQNFHCFREAHQRGPVVFEVETCDLDENGSLTSQLADKMLAQVATS